MAKNSSSKFFGAAGLYENFNSTAFAQQLTNTLSGNESQKQAQVSAQNVVDLASQQASNQIDALAQVAKVGLAEQIRSVASAATTTGASKQQAPSISTSTTFTATTTAKPTAAPNNSSSNTGASETQANLGATATTTTSDATKSVTDEKSETLTTNTTKIGIDDSIDSKEDEKKESNIAGNENYNVEGTDEILEEKKTDQVAIEKNPFVEAKAAATPIAKDVEFSTLYYVLITIAGILLFSMIAFVVYMIAAKKSFAEAFENLKTNLKSVFTSRPPTK